MSTALLLAQGLDLELGFGRILTLAGAIAAAVALLGLAIVLPLFLLHRAEINRLIFWMEAEPDKGEGEGGTPVVAPFGGGAGVATGPLTPVERVTLDRPALERITSERAAIQSQSFWERLIARGPQHPLVLSALAVLVAATAVFGVYAILNNGDGESGGKGGGLNRAEVGVVVLNGSSQPALADKVGESLGVAGFDILGTRATVQFDQTSVLFDKQMQREGKAVARELGESEIQPMSRQVKSVAGDAAVVVIAGEDRTGVPAGGGGQGGRGGG